MSSRVLEVTHPAAAAPPVRTPSAALGLRLGAGAIDFVVVATLSIVVGLCAHIVLLFLPESAMGAEFLVLTVLGATIAATYFVYSWGYEGATLGQRMLGIRVTRTGSVESGAPLGTSRAILRLAAFAVGTPLLVDWVVAFARPDGRSLHDVIADSIVVPKQGAGSPAVDRPVRSVRKGRRYA